MEILMVLLLKFLMHKIPRSSLKKFVELTVSYLHEESRRVNKKLSKTLFRNFLFYYKTKRQ